MEGRVKRGIELVEEMVTGLRLVGDPKVQSVIYDALSQVRPSKPALPEQEVETVLAGMASRGQIDCECLEVLLAAVDQRQAIAAAYRDPRVGSV